MGEVVDRILLNHFFSFLRMFIVLGIYSKSFEKTFIEGIAEFYASEGVIYIQLANDSRISKIC
jgi:hypothetical protein